MSYAPPGGGAVALVAAGGYIPPAGSAVFLVSPPVVTASVGLLAPSALQVGAGLLAPASALQGEAIVSARLLAPSALQIGAGLLAPVAIQVGAGLLVPVALQVGAVLFAPVAIFDRVETAVGLLAPVAIQASVGVLAPSAILEYEAIVSTGLLAPAAIQAGTGLLAPAAVEVGAVLLTPAGCLEYTGAGLLAPAGISLGVGLLVPFGTLKTAAVGITFPISIHGEISAGLRVPFALLDHDMTAAGLLAPSAVQVGAGMVAPTVRTEETSAGLLAPVAILARDVVGARLLAPCTIFSSEVRIYREAVSLTIGGRPVRALSIDLSMDEGSHTWLCRVGLASVADFAAGRLRAPAVLTLLDEPYALVVTGKSSGQEGPARFNLSLELASPVVLRGSPWAPPVSKTWGATDARATVEELIGPVAWTLPDWTIPAGRLAASRADPLALARQIAAAAGGVLESLPDGSVVCRPRFKIRVPDWDAALPDRTLTRGEIFSIAEYFEPVEVVNRVVISDGQAVRGKDQTESEEVEGEASRRILRVFPAPWRAVALHHTGDALTRIVPLGETWLEKTEVVPMEGGRGVARHPVWSVTAAAWQYASLGDVTAGEGSREVVAAVAGASLLKLTYRTRCWVWEVSDPRPGEVLFYAV
ncbi:MAG: hypothetical protein HQL51_03885 [Magnetococcales bacterium]|nr:hypothetical protein [Magnetococcales bacterium]